jgi:hypothetical protein
MVGWMGKMLEFQEGFWNFEKICAGNSWHFEKVG